MKTKKSPPPRKAAPAPPEQASENEKGLSSDAKRAPTRSFPIVGVGASAGGLEAFAQLFSHLPTDTGMAFVLIQHLDPSHTSLLAEALSRSTKMPVGEVEDGQRVEPNHVYVIPPNADVGILHGRLTLFARHDEPGKPHLPVDFFFRVLAADRGSQAIGVVLSGTASDGTEGLRAIKAEDGITFAQSPNSAKFGGMPHSAIDAGVVDYSLPIPALAQQLLRLSHHPYVASLKLQPENGDSSTLDKIFVVVRNAVGVDFSEYKMPTFQRRLARRMALRQVEETREYLRLLQEDPEEIRSLYRDVLIHVTSFFRDPEVFESLTKEVFPEILKHKEAGAPIRLWVAGCSTGEEVYSLAIALLEFLGDDARSHPLQIFGSDVSEDAIEKARLGVYLDSVLRDVSEERRRRYFGKTDTGYRINKNVRELCVFIRHDLARDPPFSKLDLASCRNVLIYFNPALQKRLLATFHYALTQPGFLLLGRAENISGFSQMFTPANKSNKIFARTAVASVLWFAPRAEFHRSARNGADRGHPDEQRRGVDIGRYLDRMLLARYSPPGVLINERMEVLQFRGDTAAYLQPAQGEPQNNLIKMARTGLLAELRAIIDRAKKEMGPVRAEGVEVEQDGIRRICDVAVAPFTEMPGTAERMFLVTFEEVARASVPKEAKVGSGKSEAASDARRVPKLEHELAAAREYLQTVVEDHSRTNEELNSANEELVSGNEELQSMNEELETAKEELQSTNEELTTVNDELHNRNQEANQINSDLVNLLSTVDIPILILDMERRIRRFTPRARNILNVVTADIGRPLDDIRMNIEVPDLNKGIDEVIETSVMHESEVKDRNGRWYRMQIRPYKTTDNRIDGATVSLVDIDLLKMHVSVAQQAKAEAERANRAKDDFLAILSHELRTPLSTMLLHADMLRAADMDQRAQRIGDAIQRGTKHQIKILDDLLDISRIIMGKFKMELQPVDLCQVIRAALEEAQAPARKKSLNLDVVLDETIGLVSGDPTRLQQVVSNLLNNSIKFTPEGGQVTVGLDVVEGRANFSVKDTGLGIDASFLPHVFNRFAQEDGSNTRAFGGLGLGLAIVRYLVEAHGGMVHAESSGKGKGSKFTVVLPLMTARRNELAGDALQGDAPEVSPKAREPIRLPALRVLVVDDDEGTAQVVAQMLGQAGANVRMALSAAEGMVLFEEFHPDVLLSDIAMPGEDGYSFIRRVRNRGAARGGDVPAIALTALASKEDRRQALESGFQMHIAKPVDFVRLATAVAEVAHIATSSPPKVLTK